MSFPGGCQCGRIRFEATGPRDRASICYCRMCQKAAGQPFMAFVRFPAEAVTWSTEPETFRSSNVVERGFCKECGTPLTYRRLESAFVSLSLNCLDDPEAVQPEFSFETSQRPGWLAHLDDLAEGPVELSGITSFQR